ncbi:MAG: hypothetical protein K9L98_00045 [Candidatus Pacebacteria bacterium]|nr:hypothetical protein [Candidatus Paceibacterota bacterium]MCF7862394.1 hypothetical protein [Candidatus Paceibacterota bacterium]
MNTKKTLFIWTVLLVIFLLLPQKIVAQYSPDFFNVEPISNYSKDYTIKTKSNFNLKFQIQNGFTGHPEELNYLPSYPPRPERNSKILGYLDINNINYDIDSVFPESTRNVLWRLNVPMSKRGFTDPAMYPAQRSECTSGESFCNRWNFNSNYHYYVPGYYPLYVDPIHLGGAVDHMSFYQYLSPTTSVRDYKIDKKFLFKKALEADPENTYIKLSSWGSSAGEISTSYYGYFYSNIELTLKIDKNWQAKQLNYLPNTENILDTEEIFPFVQNSNERSLIYYGSDFGVSFPIMFKTNKVKLTGIKENLSFLIDRQKVSNLKSGLYKLHWRMQPCFATIPLSYGPFTNTEYPVCNEETNLMIKGVEDINFFVLNCDTDPNRCNVADACIGSLFYDWDTNSCLEGDFEKLCGENPNHAVCLNLGYDVESKLQVTTKDMCQRTSSFVDLEASDDTPRPSRIQESCENADVWATMRGQVFSDTLFPELPVTTYFRYSSQHIYPPLYCNDIYGTNMIATKDIKIPAGTTPKDFYIRVNNLKPNTKYYYCAIASNKAGIKYGEVKSFTTFPLYTTVKAEGSEVVNPTSVYVKGSFNTMKEIKTYFEYKKQNSNSLVGMWLDLLDNITIRNTRESSWIKVGEKTQKPKNYNNAHGETNFRISDLEQSSKYIFRFVAEETETNKKVVSNTLEFETPAGPVVISCETQGTCPPETTTRPLDLSAEGVYPKILNIDGIMSLTSKINNLGDEYSGGDQNPFAEIVQDFLSHTFQINKGDGIVDINASTEVLEVKTEGIQGRGTAEISIEPKANAGDILTVRACASLAGERDTNPSNNCGYWSIVRIMCPVEQYFNSTTNTCVGPNTCAENEIFHWPTKTCVVKAQCDPEKEVYISWSNTCIPKSINCPTGSTDPFCLPGPGWGGGSGGGGGEWSGGGWDDDDWHGGTWTGSNGNQWCGGVWRNGVWTGGGWCNQNAGIPPNDALVRQGEGVEHVFVRQIMNNPTLQQRYGFNPTKNINTFAWDMAHLLAKILGYVGKEGKEIRVSMPNIAAYELRLTDNGLNVYEYYNNKIISIQKVIPVLKNKASYEYYFKK